MAKGSQVEKGNWALLVKKRIKIINKNIFE
jgi:hypothetical protein